MDVDVRDYHENLDELDDHHHTHQMQQSLSTSSMYAYDNLAYQVSWDYDATTADDHQDNEQLDEDHDQDAAENVHRTFGFLETIEEETSDEVDVSDYSGVWCWGDDLTDGADSVIHVLQESPSECAPSTAPSIVHKKSSCQQAISTDAVLAYLEGLVNHAEQGEMERNLSSGEASGEFSGEESFSSWSDAIDAYLMSLATYSDAQSQESQDLASLVGPAASIETREAIRNLILKELEAAEYRNECAASTSYESQHNSCPYSAKRNDFDMSLGQTVHKATKFRSRLVGVRSAPDLTESKELLQTRSSSSRVECDRTVYDLTAFVFEACGQSAMEDDEDPDSLECHHRSQSEPCINKMDYWMDTNTTSSPTSLMQMSAVSSRIVMKSRSLDCSECSSSCSSTCSSTEDMAGKLNKGMEGPSSSGSGHLKSFGSFDKLNTRGVDFKMESYLVGGTNAPPSSEDLSEDSGYSDLSYYLATTRSIHLQQGSLESALQTSPQTSHTEDCQIQKVRPEVFPPFIINDPLSVTTVNNCDNNTENTLFSPVVSQVTSRETLQDICATTTRNLTRTPILSPACDDMCLGNDYRNVSTTSNADPDLLGCSIAPETEPGVPVRKRANSGGALLSDNSAVVFQQEEKEEKEEGDREEVKVEVGEGGEEGKGGGADKGGTASAPWAKKHLQVGHSVEWEWACEDHNSFLDSIQTTTPTLPVTLNTDEQSSPSKSHNNFHAAMDSDSNYTYTNSEQEQKQKQQKRDVAPAAHAPPKTHWYMDFESPGVGLDAGIFSVVDDYDDDNPDGCLSGAGTGAGTGGAGPDNEKWGGSQPNLDEDDKPTSGRRSVAYYRRSFSEDCLSSPSGGDPLRGGMSTLQALHDADWWDAERVSDNTYSSPSSSTSSIPCLSQGSPVDQDTDAEVHEVESDHDKVEEAVSGCDNTNADTNSDANAAKPPLPPQRVIATKSRVIDAKKRFFNPSNPTTISKRPSDFASSEEEDDADKHRSRIQETLEGYRQRAQRGRERVARSVHDLSDIERNFNQEQGLHSNCNSASAIDRWASTATATSPSNAQSPCMPHSAPASASPTAAGYIETDIDTLVSREVLNVDWSTQTNGHACSASSGAAIVAYKTRSLFNLVAARSRSPGTLVDESITDPDHLVNARSMEFLLNEDNMANALPPENRLMIRAERASGGAAGAGVADGVTRCLSEHELRVRRSLQNLDLPKWYVNYVQRDGSDGVRSRRDSGSSSSGLETRPERWQDLKNKPMKTYRKTSRESLFLNSPVTPSPKDKSPLHIPSYPKNWRWSQGRIPVSPSRSDSPTSVQSALLPTTRSRTSSINSVSSQTQIAPYLGWRTPRPLPATSLSFYPGPHERLSNNPGYHAYPRPGSATGRTSRCSEGEGSASDVETNRLDKSSSGASKHDVCNSSGNAVPEINVSIPIGGNSSAETSLEEVVREIGKLASLNGSQELSQLDNSETLANSTTDSPSKSQKQQVYWMESSFLDPRPDKQLATPADGETSEENVAPLSPVPKTVDGLAHTALLRC